MRSLVNLVDPDLTLDEQMDDLCEAVRDHYDLFPDDGIQATRDFVNDTAADLYRRAMIEVPVE